MLAFILLTSGAVVAAEPVQTEFDLGGYVSQLVAEDHVDEASPWELPALDDDRDQSDGARLRWKLTKVKLSVPI